MKIMEKLRAISPKKWWIIGIAAGAAVLILLACLFLIPGGKKPVGGTVTPGSTVSVTVTNRAGTALEGVQVYIYGDKAQTDLVTFAKTDAEGKMSFVSEQSVSYAVLKGVHAGYQLESVYELTGADNAIVLDALATTADGSLPKDVKFSVGDPMVDFTVTDIDGNSYTASEVLKEKNALVLNFWYTACQPCQMEFPYLQTAYELYKNDVLVLAMDPYTGDSAEAVKAFRDANGLTMPVVSADAAWVSLMNIQAYPTTVVIDRFGIITVYHMGAITEEGTFEKMFAFYGGTEYNQAITDDLSNLDDVIANAGNSGSNSTTPGSNSNTTTTVRTGLQTEFTGVLGTKNEPLEVSGTLRFTTEIPAGKESYFHVYRVDGTILTIKSKTISVEYDGKTYTPKNGVIEIPVEIEDVKTPIQIILRNTGTATETYEVIFYYPAGTLANPLPLSMGALTTDIKAGNDQGVVYTYTANDHGIVELTVLSATNGVDYDVTLYNLNSYVNRTLKEDGSGKSVSVSVAKGDVLQVLVGVLPNSENEYPAAVIKSNVTFTSTAPTTKPTLPSSVTYTATVKDNKGAAMAGVALKFEVTTEEDQYETKTVTTDKNGVATAVMLYGNGKVTITVPAGYVTTKLTYALTPDAPSAAFVVELDDLFGDLEDPDDPVDPPADPEDPDNPDDPEDPEDPEDPNEPTEPDVPVDTRVDYTVKVIDGDNAAQSGITVEFYSASNELLDQVATDADGVAVTKLEKGNYIIKLSGTELRYDERLAIMTASKTTLELMVAPLYDDTVFTTVGDPLYDYEDKDVYYVGEGATYVELVPGARNYFVFEPTRTGTFRFTTVNNKATVGYYGSPFFMWTTHPDDTEIVNNAFTISIPSIGPSYVVGIDAPTNMSGTILTIVRTGDPGWTVENEPWITYEGTHVPTKFTLPANTTLVDVDITADHQEVVYNEQDGYYHLNSADGPVLYLRFGKSSYINLTDILSNQGMRVYFYDANGAFLRREEYSTYLSTYYYSPHPTYDPDGIPVNMLDKTMVYPLNADLIYILQSYSEAQRWGDVDSPNYLFKDTNGEIIPGINGDLAWMYALCYGVTE